MKIPGGAAATAPQRRRDGAAATPRRHDAKTQKKTVRKPCKMARNGPKTSENGLKTVRKRFVRRQELVFPGASNFSHGLAQPRCPGALKLCFVQPVRLQDICARSNAK